MRLISYAGPACQSTSPVLVSLRAGKGFVLAVTRYDFLRQVGPPLVSSKIKPKASISFLSWSDFLKSLFFLASSLSLINIYTLGKPNRRESASTFTLQLMPKPNKPVNSDNIFLDADTNS